MFTNSKYIICFISIILLLQVSFADEDHFHVTEEDIRQEIREQVIYYGTTVRIQSIGSQHHLHSHDVAYGQGSRQQSVTAVKQNDDYNSLWTFKNPHDGPYKTYKDEVKCGDTVRLEHNLTKKNLHSHKEVSPLSQQQEISCMGNDGNGDEGDDWIIECTLQDNEEVLKGFSQFYLKHKLTGGLASANEAYKFNNRNCGQNCPIMHQLEVAAMRDRNYNAEWKIVGGVFFQKKHHDFEWENSESDDEEIDDEKEDNEGYKETRARREDL